VTNPQPIGDTGFVHETGETERRCASCRDIGCECPKGYFATDKRCDVCSYEFRLCGPGCVPAAVLDQITCPQCSGSIDDAEDA
jgi:hypothetical protein